MLRKALQWQVLLVIVGIVIVGLGVRADQSAMKEEAMRQLYGGTICWTVAKNPLVPNCDPTTCPESGAITQISYGMEYCSTTAAGYYECNRKPEDRAECRTIIYEDLNCTGVIIDTVSRWGPDYEVGGGTCP